MNKSYMELADQILGGALTDPTKNPYDPSQGHQAHMPAMDPNDKLVEMSDTQRMALIKESVGVKVEEIQDEPITESTSDTSPSTQSISISEEDLRILSEAKKIIERIQEATTVGCIGVNMAGGKPGMDPKKVTIPGNTNVSKQPKKRTKKEPVKAKKDHSNDFIAYLGRTQ